MAEQLAALEAPPIGIPEMPREDFRLFYDWCIDFLLFPGWCSGVVKLGPAKRRRMFLRDVGDSRARDRALAVLAKIF